MSDNNIQDEPSPVKLSTSEMTKYMYSFGIKGHTIDHHWYSIIRWKKSDRLPEGKPHLEAITLLSDIVYWYRPSVDKDESGAITIEKRYSGDILQRSYAQIQSTLGHTPRESKSAMLTLESLGIARRVFRTVTTAGVKSSNIMYIEFFPVKLKELMDKAIDKAMAKQKEEADRREKKKGKREEDSKNVPPYDVQTSQVRRSNVTGTTFKRQTYTETTSESSTERVNEGSLPLSKEKRKKPQRIDHTQRLDAAQVKLFNHISSLRGVDGKAVEPKEITYWLLELNGGGTQRVQEVLEYYLQENPKNPVESLGAWMRWALDSGKSPSKEHEKKNKDYAKQMADTYDFVEAKQKYIKVTSPYAGVEHFHYHLPEEGFKERVNQYIEKSKEHQECMG